MINSSSVCHEYASNMNTMQSTHQEYFIFLYDGFQSMVTSCDFQLSALAMMGRAEVSDSGNFRRVLGACFGMSPNLCIHVWDKTEDALPSTAMIPHLL